jgi:hypothetical protein
MRIKSGNSCRSYGISSELAFSYPEKLRGEAPEPLEPGVWV